MTFVPAPNCAKVTMFFDYNGPVCQNTYFFRRDTPYEEAELNNICLILKEWWQNNLAGWFNLLNSLDRIEAVALDAEMSPGVVYTTDLPYMGTDLVNENEPGNVTVVAKWTTALRGKSYRGRTYHLGLNKTNVQGNMITAAAATSLTTAYTLLCGTIGTTIQHERVIVSTIHDGLPRVTATITPVTGCYVDRNIDSQRRRLNGRGT